MSESRIIVAILLTISSAFSVNAQATPPASCQSLAGMANISGTLLAGSWYEEFRAPAKNISCVHINVSPVNNQTRLNVTITYSASKNGVLMDQFASAVIGINQTNASSGFNVTYNNSNTVTTLKIISTDYTSKAVLCGYTNFSDPSTSFGVIATRKQIVNETWLMQVRDNASQSLPVFNGTFGAKIPQSLQCRASPAASPVPTFATVFAAFYALIKLAH